MGGHPGQDTDRLAAGREGRVAFASVVLDIPTRALPAPFDYAVPPALEAQAQVGATVLVPFSHRMAVGYVVATSQAPSPDADPARLREVEQVLAPPAFDDAAARVALWMAREYACPPCDAVRLLLAPGQRARVTRPAPDAPWELQVDRAGAVDERWASLAPAAQPSRRRETPAGSGASCRRSRPGRSASASSPPPSRGPRRPCPPSSGAGWWRSSRAGACAARAAPRSRRRARRAPSGSRTASARPSTPSKGPWPPPAATSCSSTA